MSVLLSPSKSNGVLCVAVCAWLSDAIARKIVNAKKNLTKLFRDIKTLLPAAVVRQPSICLVVDF
jgi:hypothetical protein